jgi:Bacterial protein of unknown function (DUF899)
MMTLSFPNESTDYRVTRNQLLKREIELRRMTEEVAAARHALPPGGIVPQDFVFQQAEPGATPTEVRLSELFVRGLTRWGSHTRIPWAVPFHGRKFDKSVDGASLRKRTDRPSMCPDSTHKIPQFTKRSLHEHDQIDLPDHQKRNRMVWYLSERMKP